MASRGATGTERDEGLAALIEYYRDLGVHEFYRRGEPVAYEAEPAPMVVEQGVCGDLPSGG